MEYGIGIWRAGYLKRANGPWDRGIAEHRAKVENPVRRLGYVVVGNRVAGLQRYGAC
jgi:hypothetical protein